MKAGCQEALPRREGGSVEVAQAPFNKLYLGPWAVEQGREERMGPGRGGRQGGGVRKCEGWEVEGRREGADGA